MADMEPLMKREALCMDVESNFSEELNGEQAPVQAAKQSEQSDGKPEGKKKKKAWRVMLAPEHAIEIYNRRPPLDEVIFANALLPWK